MTKEEAQKAWMAGYSLGSKGLVIPKPLNDFEKWWRSYSAKQAECPCAECESQKGETW